MTIIMIAKIITTTIIITNNNKTMITVTIKPLAIKEQKGANPSSRITASPKHLSHPTQIPNIESEFGKFLPLPLVLL